MYLSVSLGENNYGKCRSTNVPQTFHKYNIGVTTEKMIVRVDCLSLFCPEYVFTKKRQGFKGSLPTRSYWKFFHNGKSLIFKGKDSKEELLAFLGIEPEELILRLRGYLMKFKGVIGIECEDGLYVHPESLGRFLIREGKKSPE